MTDAAARSLAGLIDSHSLPTDTRERIRRSLRRLERFPRLGPVLDPASPDLRFLLYDGGGSSSCTRTARPTTWSRLSRSRTAARHAGHFAATRTNVGRPRLLGGHSRTPRIDVRRRRTALASLARGALCRPRGHDGEQGGLRGARAASQRLSRLATNPSSHTRRTSEPERSSPESGQA